jgi:SOS-response transcriptional repressor LexA
MTREFLPLPTKGSEKSFALKIIDDSMISNIAGKKSFLIGDIIFIDPLRNWKANDYVLVFNGDANQYIFRQYIADGKNSFLRALNSEFSKITISDKIKICGVVIAHSSPI